MPLDSAVRSNDVANEFLVAVAGEADVPRAAMSDGGDGGSDS